MARRSAGLVAILLLLDCAGELTDKDKEFIKEAITGAITGLRNELKGDLNELRDDLNELRDEQSRERKFGAVQAALLDRCTLPIYKGEAVGMLTVVASGGSEAVVTAKHNVMPILWRKNSLVNQSATMTDSMMLAHWEVHASKDIAASADARLLQAVRAAKPEVVPCKLTAEDFQLGERAVVFARNQPVTVSIGEIVGMAKCRVDPDVDIGDLFVSGRTRPGFSGTASVAKHKFMGVAIAVIPECTARCTQYACNTADPGAHELLGVVAPAAAVAELVNAALGHEMSKGQNIVKDEL